MYGIVPRLLKWYRYIFSSYLCLKCEAKRVGRRAAAEHLQEVSYTRVAVLIDLFYSPERRVSTADPKLFVTDSDMATESFGSGFEFRSKST
jgi:hypothetical protein